jgi:hypothetical protein
MLPTTNNPNFLTNPFAPPKGLGLPSNYTFVKRLGRGAQGDVWLAVESQTQTYVAVKIVPRGPPACRVTMLGRAVGGGGGAVFLVVL